MKMPAMNFDFGPFTESGVVALSPYGIAVRSSKGEYLTYNAVTGATIDVTGFTFDFQKMPAAIKDLRAGDMVLHRGKPMYVQSVEEDGITLPRDIIRDYIDGEKFINEIPCDSEGRELTTLNQNASKANDNW